MKATPLVMIAIGLSLCYLANVWNIGAEGQFIMGAVCGSWLAVITNGTDAGHWVLPAMLVLGALARRAVGDDPGLLQGAIRRQRNPDQPDAGLCRRPDAWTIWCAGPGATPKGINFPTTAEFDPVATVPTLFDGGRLHWGAVLALDCRGAGHRDARPHHQGL